MNGTNSEQRALLRRILIVFVLDIVLLPIAGLGGWWSLLLLPMLAAAAVGFRAALALRASRHGSDKSP